MSLWFRLVVFAVVLGISRAHHIKLIVLALLGLAGLYFMQGAGSENGGKWFSNLSSLSSAGGIATRFFSKRSAPEYSKLDAINWEQVVANDPSSCARSFVCQLAAKPFNKLSEEEQSTLNTIRISAGTVNEANKEIFKAMQAGERLQSQLHCRKIYRKCPYSRSMMLKLLTMIKSTSS